MSKKPCSISFKPVGKNKPCKTVINGGLKVKKNIDAQCDLTVKKCLNVKNIVYSNTESITESGQTVSGVKSLSWINTNGTGVLSDNTKDGLYKKIIKISEGSTAEGWTSIGDTKDIGNPVNTIVFDQNGEGPYIGGLFTNIAGITGLDTLAKWTGSSWTSIGNTGDISGFFYTVDSIAFDQNNEGPYIGGNFTDVSGITGLDRLAKWTGSSWTSVGNTGDIADLVKTIVFDQNGEGPYVGGNFTNVAGITGLDRIAKWTGSSWASVGNTGDVSGTVSTIAFDQNNEGPYIGGNFTDVSGITGLDRLAKWTGSSWTSVGNTGDIADLVKTIVFDQNGEGPYVGGNFTNVAGITGLDRIAKWTGSSWTSVGNTGDVSGTVSTIAFDQNNEGPYIGGFFTNVAGITGLDRLAKWTGSSWTSVGNTGDINSFIFTISFSPNNEGPYVGGAFTDVASLGINNLARFDQIQNYKLTYNTTEEVTLTNVGENACFIYNETLGEWVKL